eukprot:TRINITY_DN27436_c0_g1_i1.p1 TRINITY_DN27436_c0_g1~~TRINITY_DN27436_c0_g1_i1.p1  ORF type:complete len:221 (+),score=7.65 TRINITY_DN27436_c0_g1_i1:134-796(+)
MTLRSSRILVVVLACGAVGLFGPSSTFLPQAQIRRLCKGGIATAASIVTSSSSVATRAFWPYGENLEEALEDYETERLDLHSIGFTQEAIRPYFSKLSAHPGVPLDATIQALKAGDLSPASFPCLRVGMHKRRYYSLDNRRLYVLKNSMPKGTLVEVYKRWPQDPREHFDPRLFGMPLKNIVLTEDTAKYNLQFAHEHGRFRWLYDEDVGRMVGYCRQGV